MSYTPRFTNLVTMLQQSVKRYGHKPLFGTHHAGAFRYCTFAEFYDQVQRLASGLAGAGIGPGDRVAVVSGNRQEWAAGAHATYHLGAAYVPMYEVQRPSEIAYILGDSGATLCLVSTAAIRDKVLSQRDQLPLLQHVICFEDGSYDALLDNGRSHPVEVETPADDAVGSIIYTSGTTGTPKGVMLTHFNLATNVSACLDSAPFEGEQLSCAFLPWAHVFGGAVELNAMLAYGGAIAICGDSSRLLQYLPAARPTVLFAVPRVWNRVYDGVRKQLAAQPKAVQRIVERGLLAKNKQQSGERLGKRDQAALLLTEKLVIAKVRTRFGGRLSVAFSGAAALAPEVGQFVENLGISIFEGYGLTETCGGTTGNTRQARRLGSVGKPLPGVDVRIEPGVPGASPGEGEIVVYGYGVMKGYYNREAETKAALTSDGGFRTGDLGRLDADGFLYITGRIKELFKLQNGKYVSPAALEEKLQLSPYINQCVIYGSDKPYNTALVVPDLPALREWAKDHAIDGPDAAIVQHPETRLLLRAEIDAHSRDFKGYETIHDFILESEDLTPENGLLTPSLKVKRRKVMERYGTRLEALYR